MGSFNILTQSLFLYKKLNISNKPEEKKKVEIMEFSCTESTNSYKCGHAATLHSTDADGTGINKVWIDYS